MKQKREKEIKKMFNKKIFYYVGIGAGALAVIYGLSCLSFSASYTGLHTSSASFGADFYTYIYDGVKNAADNVSRMGNVMDDAFEAIVKALGMLMVVFGAADIAFFGSKLCEVKKDEAAAPKAETTAPVENVVEEAKAPVNTEEVVAENVTEEV